jgi:hypothetical protein
VNGVDQRLLDPTELAEYLGLKRKTVVDNARALGGTKVLRYWRFKLEDVEAALGRSERLDPLTPTPRSAARQASKGRTS